MQRFSSVITGFLCLVLLAGECMAASTIIQLDPPLIKGDYDVIPAVLSSTPIAVVDTDEYVGSFMLSDGWLSWIQSDYLSGSFQFYQWDVDKPVSTASIQFTLDLEPQGLHTYENSAAWFEDHSSEMEIKLWDGTSISDVCAGRYPSLFDGNIAYYTRDEGDDNEIYYLSGTSSIKITDNDYDDAFPSLHEGRIAWAGKPDIYYQIYYWDGTAKYQITSDTHSHYAPSLYNGCIAWSAEDGNDTDIFYWDGSTITQITTDSQNDDYPILHEGRIVWEHWDGNDIEIYYWDGESIYQITDNDVNDDPVSFFGWAVTWKNYDFFSSVIYYGELETPDMPSAHTSAAVDVTSSSAGLKGEVNPNGKDTSWYFEYGPTISYGQRTESQPAGNGSAGLSVEADITGLSHDTEYHYRTVATNSDGTTYGNDMSFTTSGLPAQPDPPEIVTVDVEHIRTATAAVTAVIDPNGKETTFWFEYGRSLQYGSNTTAGTIPGSSSEVMVSASLEGLQSSTIYHYHVVACNDDGCVDGADETFHTAEIMALPGGAASSIVSYLPVEKPEPNAGSAAGMKPIGVGDTSHGKFNIHVGLPEFEGPVDVYLAFYSAAVDPANVYLITPGPGFERITAHLTLTPYLKNRKRPVDQYVFSSDINLSDLPKGIYTLYIAVTPRGEGFDRFYIWSTDMVVD